MACCHARVPGASVMTAPATRPNQSKPVDRTGDQQRGRQPPAAGEVDRPGRDDTALHHHDGDAVEQRLDPVLADRRVDAAAVDVAAGGRARSASTRRSLTVRTDSSAETSDRPNRARAVADAAAERPATRRPRVEASDGGDHHREQDGAGEQALRRRRR